MAIGLPAKYMLKEKHQVTKELADEIALVALKEMGCIELGYHKEAIDYKTIGSSALSLGERILIHTGPTEILVHSECLNPAQFLDFGKNKSNVSEFFELFRKRAALYQ